MAAGHSFQRYVTIYDCKTRQNRRILVEVEVDIDEIANALALKAFKNKSGKSKGIAGAVVVHFLAAGNSVKD